MKGDAVASAPGAAGAAERARHGRSYFDGVPVGLEVEPLVLSLGDVVDGGVVVDGDVSVVAGGVTVVAGGVTVVDGDADGVRSPGFSPRRSFRDSEQAVTRPALSASAHRPVSSFFISGCLLFGLRSANQGRGLQRACPPP